MDKNTSSEKSNNRTLLASRFRYRRASFPVRVAVANSVMSIITVGLTIFLCYFGTYHLAESILPPEIWSPLRADVLRPGNFFLNYQILIPGILLIMFSFAGGLISTYRMTIALSILKQHLYLVGRNHKLRPLILRKDDELQDVAQLLNEWIATLQEREQAINKTLDDAFLALNKLDFAAASSHLEELKKINSASQASKTPSLKVEKSTTPQKRAK